MKQDKALQDLLVMAPAAPVEQYLDQLAVMSAGAGGMAALLAQMAAQIARLEALTPPGARALAVDIAAIQRLSARRRNLDLSDGAAGCVKVDEFGAPLPRGSDDWYAVSDQGYQLMWTVNPGMAGEWPHRSTRYRWAAAQEALAALNVQGWCGHRDWRLPSIDELRTLAYTARPGTAYGISDQLFPDVHGDGLFWSSSSSEDGMQSLLAWDYLEGTVCGRPLSAYAHLRFVRNTGADA